MDLWDQNLGENMLDTVVHKNPWGNLVKEYEVFTNAKASLIFCSYSELQ